MNKTMRVTLPSEPVHNGKNWSGDKELTAAFSVVAYRDGELHEVVTARCWMSRSRSASVVYAAVWVHGQDARTGGHMSFAGHGKAGGYGYCRKSAAIDEAIQSAGIRIDTSIHGAGESAIREALLAIATAMGYRRARVIEHG